jgi:N-acetylmuramoyl-L-alanine amidase
MNIKNGYLFDDDGSRIRFVESPFQGAGIKPLYLVIHYTAATTLDGTVSWFTNPLAKASAHLVIGRDGAIVQMVPFNRHAWHAGASRWGDIEGLNRFSIGIELVNAGRLVKNGSNNWVDWFGHVIPPTEVTIAQHKNETEPTGWHEYTEAQIASALAVAHALNSTYKFLDILGHDDIAPGRKKDPGPLFPMLSFKSNVLGRA